MKKLWLLAVCLLLTKQCVAKTDFVSVATHAWLKEKPQLYTEEQRFLMSRIGCKILQKIINSLPLSWENIIKEILKLVVPYALPDYIIIDRYHCHMSVRDACPWVIEGVWTTAVDGVDAVPKVFFRLWFQQRVLERCMPSVNGELENISLLKNDYISQLAAYYGVRFCISLIAGMIADHIYDQLFGQDLEDTVEDEFNAIDFDFDSSKIKPYSALLF